MSLKNPNTFGEAYWGPQVDAQKEFADSEESILAPFLAGLFSYVEDLEGFPPEIASLFRAVGTEGHFGLSDVAKTALGESGNASLMSGLSPVLRSLGYAANKKFPSALIPFPAAVTLAQRHKITPELYQSRAIANGYKEAEALMMYQESQVYPDIQSLMLWARYTTADTETFTKLQSKLDIPDDEFAIWDFLTQLRLSTSDIQGLYARGYMGQEDALLELRRDGWRNFDAKAVLDMAFAIPNATYLIQADLMKDTSNDDMLAHIAATGIHPDYAQDYLTAVLAKPNPQDIIRWRLRTDPNLTDLETDLKRLGVHPEYLDVFKALAFPVPPVGDMITMAVREAFSPDIASRFGQYDDYPQDLTKYAAMNGISEEWAKRYWAAHWSLPSPQQGFEMLHRGIITRDELMLLMRALDIMPFWRDKLIQAAYRPLTRVDVRRMYQLGVLSEDEVYRSYLDIGYDEKNARRLTTFTAKQVIASQTGFNSNDVVTAYKNSLTNRQEAYNLLADMGITGNSITQILNAAEKQREWSILNDRITGIGNEYKQDLFDAKEATERLQSLRVPNDKIQALLAKWYKESVARPSELWTKAEVVQFMQRNIIGEGRAVQELKLLGYDAEHINGIVANAKYKAK
jgi:hypothetical protein